MSKKKKQTLPPAVRSQDTLIEKSQVNNPKLDEDMEKILNSIVLSIRNCPPAQPRKKYQKLPDIDAKVKFMAKSPTASVKPNDSKSQTDSQGNFIMNKSNVGKD